MPLVPSTGLYRAVTTAPNLSADMTAALSALFAGAWPTPKTVTAAAYTQLVTDGPIVFNTTATCTYTLLPASTTSKYQLVTNIAAFAINSATANVVPLAGGAATAAILPATAGKWALLASSGVTNWQILASN